MWDYSDKVFTDTEIILIRFLASKSDTKDSAGVASLTADEIKAIENGISNVNHIGVTGYKVRIHKITWELDNYFAGENPNGHSSAMRVSPVGFVFDTEQEVLLQAKQSATF